MGSGTSCLLGYDFYDGRCVKKGAHIIPKRDASSSTGPNYDDLFSLFLLVCVFLSTLNGDSTADMKLLRACRHLTQPSNFASRHC